jgi:hypothetical protein
VKYSNTIQPNVTINTSLTGYCPFSLVINPSSISTLTKIRKIVYDFGDSKMEIKNFTYQLTSTNTLNYPFSAEPGDPRNFQVEHTYELLDSTKKVFNLNVSVYSFGVSQPELFSYDIELSTPKLDNSPFSYFNKFKLKDARMFGVSNDILYLFESEDPNYIIPVIINWKEKQTPIVLDQINIKNRAFKLKAPFEK